MAASLLLESSFQGIIVKIKVFFQCFVQGNTNQFLLPRLFKALSSSKLKVDHLKEVNQLGGLVVGRIAEECLPNSWEAPGSNTTTASTFTTTNCL